MKDSASEETQRLLWEAGKSSCNSPNNKKVVFLSLAHSSGQVLQSCKVLFWEAQAGKVHIREARLKSPLLRQQSWKLLILGSQARKSSFWAAKPESPSIGQPS